MTNNKQQTAVEFYLDKVFDIMGDVILDKLSIEQITKIHDLSKQAKAIDKGQRQHAFEQSRLNNKFVGLKYESFEQYYNETYGGNK